MFTAWKRFSGKIFATAILTGSIWLACPASFSVAAGPAAPPVRPADWEAPTLDSFGYAKGLYGGAEGDAAAGSDRYDIRHYALDLTFDIGGESITGSVRVTLQSLVEDLSDIVLDLTGQLEVSDILFRGASVPFTHADDSLTVHLPVPLLPEEIEAVQVFYGGVPPRAGSGGQYGLTFQETDGAASPIVASLSQPAYAKYWWPCKDKPGDKADSVRVKLTVPAGFWAVSNGTLEVPLADPVAGLQTYVWVESYPIASYLVSVAISVYELLADDSCVTALSGAVPLRNWVYPDDAAEAESRLAPLCDMIGFLEGLFGPYPFAGEKYGHATFEWSGAMEHQTVTSFGDLFYDAWDLLDGDRIMLHEVAHQWFGNSLGPRLWQDIWLNEGFSSYCEALWVEYNEGPEAYLANMRARQRIQLWRDQGPVFDPMPVFPGNVIYDKGAWILHMLRGRLLDDAFFALIHQYATEGGRPHGTVTTSDFIALAQQYAGDDDLTVFFDRWLEETVVPRVLHSYKVVTDPGGGTSRLELTLQQRQTPLFDNVFPVRVTTADKTVSIQRAHLFQEKQTFTYEFASEVTGVRLDPDRWVLWTSLGSPDPFLVYPNPLQKGDPGVYFQVLELAGEATLRVYDARGRLVHHGTEDASPLFWNGRDLHGRGVASGVYWAAVEFGGRRIVQKFTVLR